LNRPQLISAGIISAEVLGFFTIGEMIGKMKIVGYRGDVENGGHH
jgi:F-type H+-transporting ATPase subunit g